MTSKKEWIVAYNTVVNDKLKLCNEIKELRKENDDLCIEIKYLKEDLEKRDKDTKITNFLNEKRLKWVENKDNLILVDSKTNLVVTTIRHIEGKWIVHTPCINNICGNPRDIYGNCHLETSEFVDKKTAKLFAQEKRIISYYLDFTLPREEGKTILELPE